MNRTLVVEKCCERKINVRSFVKLQFCREEVRETERTRLDLSSKLKTAKHRQNEDKEEEEVAASPPAVLCAAADSIHPLATG